MKRERILFIDLARGFAVLFMVMVHVLSELCSDNIYNSWFGYVVEFLGSPPAAPVFMFLMGTSLMLSRKFDFQRGVIRGFKIFILGYILNFLKGTLPLLAGLQFGFLSMSDIAPYTPGSFLWKVDILQFAGLALIVLSVLRKLIFRPSIYIAIAFSIALISPLLWGKVPQIMFLDSFSTLLWGKGKYVAFPLFPWLFYPLCGMVYGEYLKNVKCKASFFRKTNFIGFISLIVGSALIGMNVDYHIGDYFRCGIGGLIWILGFVLILLWICSVMVEKLCPNKVFKILYFWSSKVTSFYFIHWIIIGWFFFVEIDSIAIALLAMLLVLIGASLLTYFWVKGQQYLGRKTKLD